MSKLVKSRLVGRPKFHVRARKVGRYTAETPPAPIPGMNIPESQVYRALNELKIRALPQASFGGGNILGGGRMDFLLPDYLIDIEFQGVFHGTTYGTARDQLRNMGAEAQGYRVVKLYQKDMRRLKPRILELIGRPIR